MTTLIHFPFSPLKTVYISWKYLGFYPWDYVALHENISCTPSVHDKGIVYLKHASNLNKSTWYNCKNPYLKLVRKNDTVKSPRFPLKYTFVVEPKIKSCHNLNYHNSRRVMHSTLSGFKILVILLSDQNS